MATDWKESRRPIAIALLILLVFWTTNSFPTRWDSESFATNSSPWFYIFGAIITYACIPICFFLFLIYPQLLIKRIISGGIWTFLTIFVLFSSLWSIEWKTTLFAALAIGEMLLIISIISFELEEKIVSYVIAITLLIISISSIAVAIALPAYGFMDTPKFAGLLRGIYSHKNILGDTGSLLLLWTICATFAGMLSKPLAISACAIGAITIAWTFSVTSIIMVLACTGLLLWLRSAYALRLNAVAFTALIVGGTLLAIAVLPAIMDVALGVFNKDTSLTGRDVIWQAYLDLAGQRPFYGYGYRAMQSSQDYGISIRFPNGNRPSPHNSYISMYVDLGWPAVALYFIANVILIGRGVRLLGARDRAGLFMVAFPVGYAINGFTEGFGGIFISIGYVLLLYLALRPTWRSIARPRRANPATDQVRDSFLNIFGTEPRARPVGSKASTSASAGRRSS